jgi:hypothetical protein
MGDRDRLFRVIVLGGIGMLGVGAQAVACGETTGTSQPDAAGFPVEGASSSGPSFPWEGASSGSFPTEGAIDAGSIATDAGPDAPEDASVDAVSDATVDAEPTDATSGDAEAQD